MRRLLWTAIAIPALVALAPASAGAKSLPTEAAVTGWSNQLRQYLFDQAAETARIEQAVYDLQGQVGAYLESVAIAEQIAREQEMHAQAAREAEARARAAVVQPSANSSSATSATSATRGAHSDAWWRGVATCEQGGRNDSYFGYFSIMDGSAGGKDWGSQVAQANGIISRYGDSAWAQACVNAGYAASPGG